MKRPSIKLALIGIFAIFAVLFGVTAYFSLAGINVLNASTTNFSGNVVPSISAAKNIQIARLQLRGAYQDHVLANTPEEMKAAVVAIAMKESDLNSAIKNYAPLVSSDYEGAAYNALPPLVEEYKTQGHKLLQLSAANKKDEAATAFVNVMAPIEKKISAQADILVKLNVDEGNAASSDAVTAYDSTLLMIYIVVGTSAVIIVASAFFGMSGIAKPVQVITRSMTALAGGDTEKSIPYAGRADEIGAMANAVEVFRQAAIDNKRLEAEAEASRIETEADRRRLTAEAEAAAQKRLQEATSGLAAGLKRLAAGDLSFELTEAFAPDFEPLRHDLNGAVAQLAETLRSVAQSTNSIDSGSREVSQSADDLSRRTEQQAASLEETAAALDQITVNVSNSSKRADEARTIAIQANASAAQSGTVVANAVNAIERIEASSTQISNIIGVIDEIAFQTNLLALNAGVEAARAGEAGRGFAVVAQEVRELAQRSAKAAKEIKGLISNSTSEVESGVKLVRATGDSLKTIEQYIVSINQHMDAIATSAREQSTGLAEVNTAVNQMDQVTQQNAAMVEETNAAGATLASEASRLRELISQFNMGQAGRTARAAPTTTAAAPHRAPVQTMAPVQSARDHRPVASPARRMVADIARSYGSTAPSQDNWEEF